MKGKTVVDTTATIIFAATTMLSVAKTLVSASDCMLTRANELVKVTETVHYATIGMLDAIIGLVGREF